MVQTKPAPPWSAFSCDRREQWALAKRARAVDGNKIKIPDWVHNTLDVIGFIPGVGDIVDGVNAVLYLAEGDYANAALSAVSLIPVAGDAIGKGGKALKAAAKYGDDIVAVGKQAVKHINNVKNHPEMAGDPNNIEFLNRAERLDAHGGNFRNPTEGHY